MVDKGIDIRVENILDIIDSLFLKLYFKISYEIIATTNTWSKREIKVKNILRVGINGRVNKLTKTIKNIKAVANSYLIDIEIKKENQKDKDDIEITKIII